MMNTVFQDRLNCKSASLIKGGSSALNQFQIYQTDRGLFFVKLSGVSGLKMLQGEAKGLELMEQADALRVPKVFLAGVEGDRSYLILEHLAMVPHTKQSQERLGRGLAQMHLCQGPNRFGLDIDNTIGLTPQINSWTDSWIEFYHQHRLGYQLKRIEQKYGDEELMQTAENLLDRLPRFFEGIDVSPSLLHGDLWGGNTASLKDGTPVVYDPACYYGHHEADLSMTNMFGGFSSHFYGAYHELIPKSEGFEERNRLYQLYHYLNHTLLFGSSYRSSCIDIIRELS